MTEEGYEPFFPHERRQELPNGLTVVRGDMTDEERKQRREDNRAMRRSKELHSGKNKHGQRTASRGNSTMPWKKKATAKHKAKNQEKRNAVGMG